jgi:uncharacterized membrane protein
MKDIFATDVKTANQVRNTINFCVPDLKFKVKKVSFRDLARSDCFVVSSNEWTPEKYQAVVDSLKSIRNAIVSD